MTRNDSTRTVHDDDLGLDATLRWELISQVFAAALEIPEPERGAWLAAHSGIDDAIRREVASLLRARHEAGGFLKRARSARRSRALSILSRCLDG